MDAKVFALVGLMVGAAIARGEGPVGTPLPVIAEQDDNSQATEPPEPARLAIPPWLVPIEDDSPVGGIAAAFEIDEVRFHEPDPAAGNVVVVSDVRAMSANSPIVDPRTASILAHAEKLAEEARSIGDLNDLIEQCGALGEGFPITERDHVLARVASWAFNRRGEMRVLRGDDRDAYDDFQRSVEIDPNNWTALHNRGLTRAQYGQLEQALSDFDRALDLNPQLGVGYGNRAEVLLALGDLERAEADYSRAIAHAPDNAALFAGRAAARRLLGDRTGAVRDLNDAVQLDPNRAEARVDRGALYAEAGFYEQAVADFDAALRVDPRSVVAYQSLAWLLSTCHDARFRDAEKAVESARRALRLGDAGDPMLLDAAAAAHASAGLTEEAVLLEQQALLVAPAELRDAFEHRLALYRGGNFYRQPSPELR